MTKASKNKQPLKVTYKKLEELVPYARNSRTHSDEQVAQVAASIKEFGFTNPILIDEEGGIIAGHGRVLASTRLKLDKVPTITLAGLSEAQKRAYVIADNKLALNAGWDFELLSVELADLDQAGFDLDLVGFDADELAEIGVGIDDEGMPDLADGDREPFQQMTFTLHDEQAEIVDNAIMKAKTFQEYDTGLNENSNGNALAFIVERWLKSLG